MTGGVGRNCRWPPPSSSTHDDSREGTFDGRKSGLLPGSSDARPVAGATLVLPTGHPRNESSVPALVVSRISRRPWGNEEVVRRGRTDSLGRPSARVSASVRSTRLDRSARTNGPYNNTSNVVTELHSPSPRVSTEESCFRTTGGSSFRWPGRVDTRQSGENHASTGRFELRSLSFGRSERTTAGSLFSPFRVAATRQYQPGRDSSRMESFDTRSERSVQSSA